MEFTAFAGLGAAILVNKLIYQLFYGGSESSQNKADALGVY